MTTPARQFPDRPDAAGFVRATLAAALAQVQSHMDAVDAVDAGSGEAERIHQLRVALRRLRTLLRECAGLAPGIRAEWDAPLALAFARLGTLRDAGTLADVVRPLLQDADAPLCEWTVPDAGQADADAAAAVREPQFLQTLAEIHALAQAPAGKRQPGLVSLSAAGTRKYLARRLARLHRQVLRDGRHFDRLPLAQQHRVRKRLKRLRYLADFAREFAPGMWPGKKGRRFAEALVPAQDALGLHNDMAVAAALFRDEAGTDPRAWFAAGYLQARLATSARSSRRALRALARVPGFWA
ncbi:CHAD domain-containing protein [Delftia tsuruhatensis]|uniref:Metal-chelation protein CHAD n=2 Tax=Delftia tsuruhatensis TaxID=180282 RepID=A0ABN4SM04_9BURK|nr:CHAD domain-containing protein [Delftia tsuruhatensis]AOV04585.1 metal-chelation protein CHAD [Delftia tsuruhatensis]MDH2229994.1 CHAD domain-containing protein [Delftia tsuruhatensis]